MATTRVVNIKHEDCDVLIDRSSVLGNPYRIGRDGTREEVLAKYRAYILSEPALLAELPKLRGKRLGCHCKPKPCHGDILVELLQSFHKVDPRNT